MGFSILSALGGAAKGYTDKSNEMRKYALEQMRETSSRIQERFDKAIADRTSQKADLEKVGSELRDLGLDTDQALVLLQQGGEKASAMAERIRQARVYDPTLSPADIVQLSNPDVTGLSMEEGINNIIGIASSKPMAGGMEFGSRSTQKHFDRMKSNLEQQYGMSYDQIRNIAYGNVERGALPTGTVATDKLYGREELEAKALRAQVRSAEAGATVAEVEAGSIEEMTDLRLRDFRSKVKAGEFEADTLQEKLDMLREKHDADMDKATSEQMMLDIDLIYHTEKTEAEIALLGAKTAAEEADLQGGSPFKLNDMRNLYKDSFNQQMEQRFKGKVYMAPSGNIVYGTLDEGERMAAENMAKLHAANFLQSTINVAGLDDNAAMVFESFTGGNITVVNEPVTIGNTGKSDQDPAMARMVQRSKNGEMFVDSTGRTYIYVVNDQGNVMTVDPVNYYKALLK